MHKKLNTNKRKPSFRSTLLAGVVVILPLVITVWFLSMILGQIDALVTPMVLASIQWLGLGAWAQETWVTYVAPLVSLGLTLVVIYLVGRVAQNVLGRQLLRGLDWIVMRVPVARGIYSAIRQFLDTFTRSPDDSFSQVVLLEYPRRDVWTIGLLTAKSKGEVQERTDKALMSVYVPTTPNPTSGFLVFVPEADLVPLTMSVEEAFKLIISGGVLSPDSEEQKAKAAG